MLDSFERYVLMYDLTLRTARKDVEFPSLSEIAPLLVERVKSNDAYMFLRPDSPDLPAPWMRIKDARIVNIGQSDGLALLLSIGDPRGANPSFEHAKTAAIRTIEKQEGEGKAVAAHCVVSLREQSGSPRYRMIVEDIRGLGRSRIRDLLAQELKVISEQFGLEYTNNAKETVSTYIIPELEGRMSEKLQESLDRGTITGINLVDTRVNEQLDEVDGVEITRREMKVSLAHVSGEKTSLLERVKRWAAENNYDKMRLVWNDPEGAGKPERAWVETAQQDVKDTYFVKQAKVTVSKPLDEACMSLRDDMLDAICKLV